MDQFISCCKAIGSDPSSGVAYCIQGFLHVSCPKSVHGSTETVPGLLPSKTELIDNVSSLDIAPWTLSTPTVRFDLTKCREAVWGVEGSRLEAWMKSHKSEVAIT